MIPLRVATKADLTPLVRLLEACDLPADDIASVDLSRFVLCEDRGTIAGAGGLEIVGSDALFRSLAVLESHRGRGIAGAILDHLCEMAREAGVENMFLLTTTAGSWFRERGWAAFERDSAPAPIRATAEFRLLCPDDADCLIRRL